MKNYEKLCTGVWVAYDFKGKAHRIRKEMHKSGNRWYGAHLTAKTLKILAKLIGEIGR
jgi:hypothetical protein